MQQTLRLNILSDPANLADVRKQVEAMCAACQFGEAAVGEIGLCVNEAMANVIRHAYHGAADRQIELDARCDEKRFEITIRDWGNGIDPSRLPPREPDPLVPGGLGLICLRKMMDEVEFIPQRDGMMLQLARYRERTAGG